MINIWPTTVYHHVHCKTPIVATVLTVPFLSWHRWPPPLPVTRDGTRLPSDSSFEQLHGVVTNTSWFSTPTSLSTASLSRESFIGGRIRIHYLGRGSYEVLDGRVYCVQVFQALYLMDLWYAHPTSPLHTSLSSILVLKMDQNISPRVMMWR